MEVVDIKIKDLAMKFQWIFCQQHNQSIKTLATVALDNKIGNLIWECQLSKKDFRKIFKKKNFWIDLLKNWNEHNYLNPLDGEAVKEQILWLNSKIRVNKEPVCWINWIQKGIIYVKDLYNESGEILSYAQIVTKKGKIPFTEFEGIKAAIPREWKAMMRNGEVTQQQSLYSKIKRVESKPIKTLSMFKEKQKLVREKDNYIK